jgi:hypothetical protein
MDKIKRPQQPGNYPDRGIDCEEAMDIAITQLVDDAGRAGWTVPEALDGIARAADPAQKPISIDPDPADDQVD